MSRRNPLLPGSHRALPALSAIVFSALLSTVAAGCGDAEGTSGSGGSGATTSSATTAAGGTNNSGGEGGSGGAGGTTSSSGGSANGGSANGGSSPGGSSTGGSGGSSTGGSGGGPPISLYLADSPCPPRFVDDIVSCADGLLADPDSGVTSWLQAIFTCADATPVSDAFAVSCARDIPAPIYCKADDAAVWSDLSDHCTSEAITGFAERTCVFGARYRDAFHADRLLVLSSEVLDASSPLNMIEAQQVVSAIEPSAYDATTPAEAFDAVDGNTINRTQFADRYNGQRFTALEYGAGDNSYGRFFHAGTAATAANIQDGDLYDCSAEPGPGGQTCENDGLCAPLTCEGQTALGRGKCLVASPEPEDGDPCAAPLTCAPGAFCAGLSAQPDGVCVSPWKTGVFRDIAFAPLVDGGELARVLEVKGLATVPFDVVLDLVIHHPEVSQLTVTLANPSGTIVTVFAGDPGGQDLVLDGTALTFPGDEIVNGDWTLRITDANGGDAGWLEQWQVFITSRFD